MSSLEKQEFSPLTQKYNKVEVLWNTMFSLSLFKLSWVMHLKPIRVHLALHHYNTYFWESPDLSQWKASRALKSSNEADVKRFWKDEWASLPVITNTRVQFLKQFFGLGHNYFFLWKFCVARFHLNKSLFNENCILYLLGLCFFYLFKKKHANSFSVSAVTLSSLCTTSDQYSTSPLSAHCTHEKDPPTLTLSLHFVLTTEKLFHLQ